MKLAITPAGILSCLIMLVLGSFASAAEPPKPAQQGVPILSKIPYLSRLFKNTGPAPDCQKAEVDTTVKFFPQQFRIVGTDGLERIGVDFDCQVVEAIGPCCEESFVVPTCRQRAVTCPACCDAECRPAVTVRKSHALADVDVCRDREAELLGELFEARLEAVVAQTQLKAHNTAAAKEAKLRNELLAARLENANLQARLELAGEKEKLAAELHQAQLELVALKGKVGPAAAKLTRRASPRGSAETERTTTDRR